MRALSLAIVVAACASSAHVTRAEPVSFRYTGERLAKPPLDVLAFDVTLVNDEAAPRWFVLPALAVEIPKPATSGVNVVEPRRLDDGTPWARLLGTGGVQAYLVPARGRLHVPRLELQLWTDRPAELALDLTIAADVRVGDHPIGAPPVAYRTTDDAEAPLVFIDGRTIPVRIPLPAARY
jgi:hypothetical protein